MMRQIWWFVVTCLLLLLFFASPSSTSPNLDGLGDGSSRESLVAEEIAASKLTTQESGSGCCNHTEPGHHIEVQFSSKVVQNEYIVTFTGYFNAEEREEHIKRALNGSKGSVSFIIFGSCLRSIFK